MSNSYGSLKDFLLSSLSDAGTGTEGSANVFVGVDPANNQMLVPICEGYAKNARCLYIGSALEEYGKTAPWIFEVDQFGKMIDYLSEEHLGEKSFIFFVSDLSFDDFHLKLRKFTKIKTTDDQTLFWRIFEPDNIGTLIPFMTARQRQHFFSGITKMIMEVFAGEQFGLGEMALRSDGILLTKTLVPDADVPGRFQFDENEVGQANDVLPAHMAVDVAGADCRPLMTFTPAQLEAPVLFNRPRLIRYLIRELREDFGPAMDVLPTGLLEHHINHGVNLAIKYRLHDVNSILIFIDLMMRIAPGWHRQKRLNDILIRTDLSPSEKLRVVTGENLDRAWDEAATFKAPEEWMANESEGQV